MCVCADMCERMGRLLLFYLHSSFSRTSSNSSTCSEARTSSASERREQFAPLGTEPVNSARPMRMCWVPTLVLCRAALRLPSTHRYFPTITSAKSVISRTDSSSSSKKGMILTPPTFQQHSPFARGKSCSIRGSLQVSNQAGSTQIESERHQGENQDTDSGPPQLSVDRSYSDLDTRIRSYVRNTP